MAEKMTVLNIRMSENEKEQIKEKADKIKPFLDLFLSEKIGNLFSANGKFPTTNPNVDNHLEENQNFKWVGWDFIYKNDVGKIIRDGEKLFDEEIKKYF